MIVDTGILYALIDREDGYHSEAKEIFAMTEPKVIPEPVVVETDWLILERLGVDIEISFLRELAAETTFSIEPPAREDRERAAELVAKYHEARIGYVDAIVVAVAERLEETTVATLDQRHFNMIRPRHVRAFKILP